MKAVIFYATDNWNNDYKYVVIAEDAKVHEVINENQKASTEIYDFEIVECFKRN